MTSQQVALLFTILHHTRSHSNILHHTYCIDDSTTLHHITSAGVYMYAVIRPTWPLQKSGVSPTWDDAAKNGKNSSRITSSF